MPDCFVIFYRNQLLIILTDFGGVLPERDRVLRWYAAKYGFPLQDLTGVYMQSLSVCGMKYEDFIVEPEEV